MRKDSRVCGEAREGEAGRDVVGEDIFKVCGGIVQGAAGTMIPL